MWIPNKFGLLISSNPVPSIQNSCCYNPHPLSQKQKRFTISLVSLSYAVCDEDHLIYLWFRIRRSVSLNSQLQMSAGIKNETQWLLKQQSNWESSPYVMNIDFAATTVELLTQNNANFKFRRSWFHKNTDDIEKWNAC